MWQVEIVYPRKHWEKTHDKDLHTFESRTEAKECADWHQTNYPGAGAKITFIG